MRKTAFLIAIVFAATSPSLAFAKKAKKAKKAPVKVEQSTNLNANTGKLLGDMFRGK